MLENKVKHHVLAITSFFSATRPRSASISSAYASKAIDESPSTFEVSCPVQTYPRNTSRLPPIPTAARSMAILQRAAFSSRTTPPSSTWITSHFRASTQSSVRSTAPKKTLSASDCVVWARRGGSITASGSTILLGIPRN